MREFKSIIVFIVLVAAALFVFWILQAQRENERNQPPAVASDVEQPLQSVPPKKYPAFSVEERAQLNAKLELPEDYPVEIVPLYGGMEVLETETGDAESSEGEPMLRWLVRGQSVASQSDVADFYKAQMKKLRMGQTMTVSKPGEHGVDFGLNYADENYDIRFEIERQRDDTQTQIKLEVFKLVGE